MPNGEHAKALCCTFSCRFSIVLPGCGWAERLPAITLRDIREFERLKHSSRSPAGIHTCTIHVGPLRAPRPRAQEQTRGRKRKSWPMCQKSPWGTSTHHFFALLDVGVQVARADNLNWPEITRNTTSERLLQKPLTPEQTLHLVGYSTVPTPVPVFVQRRRFWEV